MARASLAVIGLLVLGLGAAPRAAQTDWPAIIKQIHKQILRIEIKQGDSSGICSGVVVNAPNGFLLTAAHCTGTIKTRDETSITVDGRHAELARANEILDLASVRFSPRDYVTMPLAPETPPAGTEVAVIGFLLGSKHLHTQYGHISAKRNEDGAVVIDSAILPGDSGGAIIDSQGRLVAMTNQYYQGTAIGLAVPVEVLEDFVAPYLPKLVKP